MRVLVIALTVVIFGCSTAPPQREPLPDVPTVPDETTVQVSIEATYLEDPPTPTWLPMTSSVWRERLEAVESNLARCWDHTLAQDRVIESHNEAVRQAIEEAADPNSP